MVTDYLFQHNYNRVEQTAKRLGKKPGSFKLEIAGKEGQELESSLEVPDPQAAMEFAIAMSRFLRRDSLLSADAWIDFLVEVAGSEHDGFFDSARKQLEHAKEGLFRIEINGRQMPSEEVYHTLATNVVFADDIAAKEYCLRFQSNTVLENVLWMAYYNYCLDVWRVLFSINEYRRLHRIRPPNVPRKNQCIYCKGKTGSFTKTEHIIPESLGNETSLLPPGFVCDRCNEALGNIENAMVSGQPFKLLRPLMLWENKKGKLPSARFSNMHIERVSPNELKVHSWGNDSSVREEELASGRTKLTFDTKGRLDAHALARGLMKMGLGVIALEEGAEVALEPRYDAAREYIVNGSRFPNKMALVRRTKPHLGGTLQWFHTDEGGTAMWIQILGAAFVIALTVEPELSPPGEWIEQFLIFDLREEKPVAA